jgi:hypothetical protein
MLLAILESPAGIGETIAAAFARRERELIATLSALSVFEARALEQRLRRPRATDLVARAFSRWTEERRSRVLAFLADARRREALANARRAG